MQSLYSQVQRGFVGCHSRTSGHIIHEELGSRPLSSWQKQQQLNYCQHLHSMTDDRLTKLAATKANCKAPDAWHTVEKNLMHDLDITPAFFNPPVATDSDEPKPPSFRTRSREVLQQYDTAQLQQRATTSTTLHRYLALCPLQNETKKVQEYLAGPTDQGASLLLQCRAGTLLTREYTRNWKPIMPNTCPSCADGPETIAHLLLDCPFYQNLPGKFDRAALDAKISTLLTPDQNRNWLAATAPDKEAMLLGATWLGGPTATLHTSVKQFLTSAWKARQQKIDNPATGEETLCSADPALGPSRTPTLPVSAPFTGLPPMGQANTATPSTLFHAYPDTTAMNSSSPAHTNPRRAGLRSGTKRAQGESMPVTVTCPSSEVQPSLGTHTPSVLGARLTSPIQTGLTSIGNRLSHRRVANGLNATA